MKKRKSKYTVGDFKLRVGKSASGKGLFAEETIPKGVCIIEYTGREATAEEIRKDTGKYLFWTGEKTMINGNIPSNLARYINHSCAPNCEATGPNNRVFIFSLRAIKAGEELSYNYGDEYFDEIIKPAGCRCSKCSG